MSFTNLTTGKSHSFGGTYLELKPHEHVRCTNKFQALSLPGKMQVTISLKPVFCGTDLSIVQESIPAEVYDLGWPESLTLLAKPVEAEIPKSATKLPGAGLPRHYAAARPSSASLRTVFQFRAVLVTPIHLSNFSAIWLLPKPNGVCK